MKLFLSRRGGTVTICQQIVWQIEMQILTGELAHGQKLPSIRSLARSLRLAPGTVLLAYAQLAKNGNVELHPGSGALVRRGAPPTPRPTESLDRLLNATLKRALEDGWSADEVRAMVRRWLDTPPPGAVLVVDMQRETAEVIVEELRPHLKTSLHAMTLDEVTAATTIAPNAICVALHFHAAQLEQLIPETRVVAVEVHVAEEVAAEISRLPRLANVATVSHSPRVLQYVKSFLQGLRGDDLILEFYAVRDMDAWSGTVNVADIVLVDALAAKMVKGASDRMRVFRIVGPKGVTAIQHALALPVPGNLVSRVGQSAHAWSAGRRHLGSRRVARRTA